jgi:hypothetical protein
MPKKTKKTNEYGTITKQYTIDTKAESGPQKYQYVGDLKNDREDGKGTMVYAIINTKYYDDSDEEDGESMQSYSKIADSKDVYTGEWKNGKRHGEGTMTFNIIQGEYYFDDTVNPYYKYQKKTIKAQWEHDKIVDGTVEIMGGKKKSLTKSRRHGSKYGGRKSRSHRRTAKKH